MPKNANLLLVDKHAVETLLKSEDIIEAVRDSFLLNSQGGGRLFPVIREQLSTGGIFGIKSGDIPSQGLLGMKASGFWQANTRRKCDPNQSTILLFDPSSGRPMCVIDGNAVTRVRSGAAGGLGLQQLARKNSERLSVFGTGVQGRIQLSFALMLLPSLKHVTYLTESGKHDPVLEKHFGDRCTMSLGTNPNTAVAESDVVITATPASGPLFDLAAVKPGTHFNCVGTVTRGKRELPEGLLKIARLFVDDIEQARSFGECQWLPEAPCVELGDVFSGKTKVERTQDDITVFDMTGLALQDLTVAGFLFEQASAAGLGTEVAWPW